MPGRTVVPPNTKQPTERLHTKTIRLTKSDIERVEAIAQETGHTFTATLRYLVEAGIAAYDESREDGDGTVPPITRPSAESPYVLAASPHDQARDGGQDFSDHSGEADVVSDPNPLRRIAAK